MQSAIPPALIVRSAETEQQARDRYQLEHGHPPPAGVPVIRITRCTSSESQEHEK